MNYLPMDVVNIILEYQGYHVFRGGKYIKIKRIPKTDKRYDILMKRPSIIKEKNDYYVNFKQQIDLGEYIKYYDYEIKVDIRGTDIYWKHSRRRKIERKKPSCGDSIWNETIVTRQLLYDIINQPVITVINI